ncbi:MAG: protein kinase, partial [Acidobacteriota bacterium]
MPTLRSTGGFSSTVGSGPDQGGRPFFAPGSLLAERYRVVAFLARGGMGEVYEADDLALGQRVALKTISARLGADTAAIDRFKREIALARLVTHPNVCRIFDLGRHVPAEGGEPVVFLSMELLRGETLAALLKRRGRLTPAEAQPLAAQMAEALEAAHRAGVVHRDFKSENVFLVAQGQHADRLDDARVVVTDFGVARGAGPNDALAARVTGAAIVGTPAYMAPEQVEGTSVGPAADLYAFGIVLFEMVTGELPFRGSSPLSTAVARLREPAPTPRLHVPALPEAWERTILGCLERAPENRPSSAREALQTLDAEAESRLAIASDPRSQEPDPAGSNLASRSQVADVAGTGGSPSTTATDPPPLQLTKADGASDAVRTQTPGHTLVPTTTTPSSMTQPVDRPTKPAGRARATLLGALLVLVAVASAMLWWRNRETVDPSEVRLRRSVAVVGFQNLGSDTEVDWLSTALAEMLGTELSTGGALRTIASAEMAPLRRELSLDGRPLEADDLTRLRELTGCDYVIAGSFVGLGEGAVRIDARLRDAAVGTTIVSASESGPLGELPTLVVGLSNGVRSALGVERGDDAFAGQPTDARAARLYAEALDALAASDPQTARDRLVDATSIEDANPLLHAALSSAWQALGFRQEAEASARRAFERSSRLPREDRLAVEAKYRETVGEWGRAAELYEELWEVHPDDLNVGLNLVEARLESGDAVGALSMVDRLRRLPDALASDPRLDLAESEAAAALSQVDRQREAARRAVEKAEGGSQRFLARALLAEALADRRLERLEAAETAARRALDAAAAAQAPTLEALATVALGNVQLARGAVDDAEPAYRRAIDLYRQVGDRGGAASSLNNLAVLTKRRGRLDEAEDLYRQAEAVYRETSDARGLANTLNNLALVHVERDTLTEAQRLLEEAEDVWARVDGPSGEAFRLGNLAAVARYRADFATARQLGLRARELHSENGARSAEAQTLAQIVAVEAAAGRLEEANQLLEEAERIAEASGSPAARLTLLYRRGELARLRGDDTTALSAHGEARDLANELGRGAAALDNEL